MPYTEESSTMNQALPCPCCGFLTLSEPSGNYDICPVCFWEDDPAQLAQPKFTGGANEVSLEQARLNYSKFGASSPSVTGHVRLPRPDERPSPEVSSEQ